MIYLYTDFGSGDIYLGQMKAILRQRAPMVEVIDLCNDLPSFRIAPCAHLLAALLDRLPDVPTVLLGVVDPGVGGARRAVVVQADGRWLVGPDNGLLSVAMQRAQTFRSWEIRWLPPTLSRTFHGRDLFAPIAAMLATNALPAEALEEIDHLQVCVDAADLFEVIYIDHYGNALTGIRASSIPCSTRLLIGSALIAHAETFSEVAQGALFWYENSLGLVEVAVNQGSAAVLAGLQTGAPVSLCT